MSYTITEFTPWSGLLGGALIGLASVLMLFLTGRIAGISGIVAGTMTPAIRENGWRLLFIAGLVLGAPLYSVLSGATISVEPQFGPPLMILGGFLVGFGTRLGCGCTAGHGISGLARLSIRSAAATATFFVTAIVTVYLVRHVIA